MPRGRPRKNQRQQELSKNPLPIIDTVTTNSSEDVVKEVSSETTKTEDSNEDSKLLAKLEIGLEVETVNKGRPKKDDTPRCVCCKEPVYSRRRLNLSLLTTLASYHFAVEEMQPYICSRCASDLGEVINKWLIKHGAEVKPYYKPEYMAKNYDENLNNSTKNLKEDNSNG